MIPIYLFLILLLNVGTYFPSLAFQPLVSSKRVCFRGRFRTVLYDVNNDVQHDDMDVLNNGLNNVDKAVLNRLLEGENKP